MAVGCGWFGAVGASLGALASYTYTPGAPAAEAPERWPEASALPRDPERATLLLFAHPGCPCSRASLTELAALLREVGPAVQATVVFMHVAAGALEKASSLRIQAAEIPGVRVFDDAQGTEARRFDARTSGQTLLYDRSGARLFAGGLTMARGHVGKSIGHAQIIALLAGAQTSGTAKVFGCSLHAVEAPAAGRKNE